MRVLVIAINTALFLWSGIAAAELEIKDGYVRALPPGQPNTAAFMRLVNTGDKALVIDSAVTGAAKRAEIHAHVQRDGMMSMRQVEHLRVPANGEFVLAPGGHHLMLIDLTAPLRDGNRVTIQLFSGNTELVNAELPVRSVLHEHHHH